MASYCLVEHKFKAKANQFYFIENIELLVP